MAFTYEKYKELVKDINSISEELKNQNKYTKYTKEE